MNRIRPFLALLTIVPTVTYAQCRLCAPGVNAPPAAQVPLNIAVDATLDLGRAAQTLRNGAGAINLDPRSGARTVTGTLADLGGLSLRGTVRLTGAPFAAVVVSLPNRIQLTAPDGSTADIVEIRTDLGSNAALDAQGRLSVGFGGRLIVTGGAAGDFRGRIPVTADYR
jgi:multidrug efflux pump subunit AcrA (membrane-fusion protein)